MAPNSHPNLPRLTRIININVVTKNWLRKKRGKKGKSQSPPVPVHHVHGEAAHLPPMIRAKRSLFLQKLDRPGWRHLVRYIEVPHVDLFISIFFLFIFRWKFELATSTSINTQVFLFSSMMLQKSNPGSFLCSVFSRFHPFTGSWTWRGRHIISTQTLSNLSLSRKGRHPVPIIPNQRLVILRIPPHGIICGVMPSRTIWIATIHSTLLSTTATTTFRRYPHHLQAPRATPRAPPLMWLLLYRNHLGRSLLDPKS